MEKRTILAILISIVFIIAWEKFVIRKYFPKKPAPAQTQEEQAGRTAVPDEQEPPEDVVSASDVNATAVETSDNDSMVTVQEAEQEETYTLSNDVMILTWTNRGGALESIQLKDYENEKGHPVELVNPRALGGGMLPLSLWMKNQLDHRLYHVEQLGNRLVFTLGDVSKTVELGEGYTLHVSVNGVADAEVSLGAGIEESERANSRYATEDGVVWYNGSDVERIKKKKLKEESIPGEQVKWIAIEDKYFARIFIPDDTTLQYDLVRREYTDGEKQIGLSSVLVGGANTISGKLYLGPKHYDSMKALGQGLEKIVNFGFFGVFAKWLFFGLKAVNNWVGNYGWTIVLLTILIRILLFPLNQASLKSTRKMQTVQPKIKAIQQKYKKYGSDMTMKQKMNQEIAELYKKEGVNPLGGCLPMLLQMPIFFAFWSLLLNAIELRHAPFMLWIRDLSAHDPYYVLPILMGLSQLISQIITPSTGDPNQKRMMYLLPIVFTVILAYAPSGLILYWTTNNIFQILQQLLINRKMAAAA